MTLPAVWIPEANEDLLEARAWYDNIRVEVENGSRLRLKRRSRQSRIIRCNFPWSTGAVGARECGAFLTDDFLKSKSTGLWSSRASTAGATQDVGKRADKADGPIDGSCQIKICASSDDGLS